MPVSDFLENEEFSRLLADSVSYPSDRKEIKKIIVPQTCDNASLVGTAFEFLLQYELLRYYIETKPIISLYDSRLMLGMEKPRAIQKLTYENRGKGRRKELKVIRYVWPSALGVSRVKHLDDADIEEHIYSFFHYAESELKEYENSLFGADMIDYIRKNVLVVAIKLAKLETFYRSGVFPKDFDNISENDLLDLKSLVSQVNGKKLDANSYCLCGPYFSNKGRHVTGFDMDLVLDNMIVDVKTTKYSGLTKEQINQLVVYYLLSRVFGIEAYPLKKRIEEIAVYFARYDSLQVMNISELLTTQNEMVLKKWIKERIVSCG